jgi:hypothetical protein
MYTHSSYVSVWSYNFCQDNSIIVVSIHVTIPHPTKCKSLDVSSGLRKPPYNREFRLFLRRHPYETNLMKYLQSLWDRL